MCRSASNVTVMPENTCTLTHSRTHSSRAQETGSLLALYRKSHAIKETVNCSGGSDVSGPEMTVCEVMEKLITASQ